MRVLKLDGTTYRLSWQRDVADRRSLVAIEPEYGLRIAYLSWHIHTGEIKTVAVDPSLRRHGFATALLSIARERYPKIHHSAIRTDLGEAWASSLDEELPARFIFKKGRQP